MKAPHQITTSIRERPAPETRVELTEEELDIIDPTKTIQTWTKHRTRILSTTIQHSSNTQQKQNRRQQPKNNIQENTKTRSKARRKIICTN